jgi:hypothetical protein
MQPVGMYIEGSHFVYFETIDFCLFAVSLFWSLFLGGVKSLRKMSQSCVHSCIKTYVCIFRRLPGKRKTRDLLYSIYFHNILPLSLNWNMCIVCVITTYKLAITWFFNRPSRHKATFNTFYLPIRWTSPPTSHFYHSITLQKHVLVSYVKILI